eukprot:COSAG02_NODE_2261_length_9322_cov_152.037298_2_plen_92_part_00
MSQSDGVGFLDSKSCSIGSALVGCFVSCVSLKVYAVSLRRRARARARVRVQHVRGPARSVSTIVYRIPGYRGPRPAAARTRRRDAPAAFAP